MKIINANRNHAKEISVLMLADLEYPNPRFPKDMIDKFRTHAEEHGILKEFENPKLIAFVAISKNNVVGFIVGYEENHSTAMIHYVNAKKHDMEEKLLNRFIEECKFKDINKIRADAFEFMDNNEFFKSHNFVFVRKEKLAPNLEMLWYELNL